MPKPPTLEAMKSHAKTMWTSGDFGEFAKYVAQEAEEFVSQLEIKPGMKVLDVACGVGNAAIAAARRGAIVTGLDFAPNLLAQARAHARQADVEVQFDEGECDDLPYDDNTFDLVFSTFGVMFAVQPERAAAELMRVTKPGGRVVVASWTPSGFIGDQLAVMTKYAPPPPNAPSPLAWGEADKVRSLFQGARDVRAEKAVAHLELPMPVPEAVELQRRHLGPVKMAFDATAPEKQPALRADLESLFAQRNKGTRDTTVIDSEYLKATITAA